MKKHGILHAELSKVIAALGHGDAVVIGDAGLPVPAGVPCIDLALTLGVPKFSETLQAVSAEMCVETALVADEMGVAERGLVEGLGVTVKTVSHEELKAQTASARAVIRTGEATPYANVILYAGVVF